MRLLAHVHGYPPTHNAGAEHYLHAILRRLVERGHEVRVLSRTGALGRWDGDLDGVQVTCEPDSSTVVDAYLWSDVVLTHLDLTRRVIDHCFRQGKPLAYVLHNQWSIPTWHIKPWEAGLLVVNSAWLSDETVWRGRRLVVPPLVDEWYTGPRGDAITLLNLNENKGGRLFWDLAERLPQYPFLGVRGAYGEQIVPRPLPPNGEAWPHQVDVREAYLRTRVLLMPSESESWGRAAIEAAASGIPTIAHPTPGLRESLGDSGLFIDRSNVKAWASAITMLMDDESAYAAASRAARARFERLAADHDHVLDSLEREILALIDRHQRVTCTEGDVMTRLRVIRDFVGHEGDLRTGCEIEVPAGRAREYVLRRLAVVVEDNPAPVDEPPPEPVPTDLDPVTTSVRKRRARA